MDGTDGDARLWRAVRPETATHAVRAEELGEYAALLRRGGTPAAAAGFPAVAAHLEAGCPDCTGDLDELLRLLDSEEAPPFGHAPPAPEASPGVEDA
jgi:hypothetical protein